MRVALTYDDGPSAEWTRPILDALAEQGARATFFVCGHAIDRREAILRRIVEEGHEVGNHSWSHPRLTALSDAEVQAELRTTSTAIYYATAVAPSLWRAPNFDHDARTDLIAAAQGLTHVGCDFDSGDWVLPDAARIAANVLARLADGAVVDLHDGIPPDGGTGTSSRQPTVEATALILASGHEFVTVSELWASSKAA